ncbi:MAG: hypothetical protein EZS28_002420 [Streblomastix strix]|uniref:Uncharacterized protein n=1 Tax=Streblomastix strix TaxID=222440 RepID=A0A5J4X609_9EUKA|nr:MAG: hypothetical protein EZS28_002420 [Streblomastix strix]
MPRERILQECKQKQNRIKLFQFNCEYDQLTFEQSNQNTQLGAQLIAKSDIAKKYAIGITNLLFGIQQLGKTRVKTKRFRQLTPSAIQKQIMRSMLNQNENQALEQNQEILIRGTHNDIPSQNSGQRGQPPSGQGLYAQRNAAISQSTIFLPALNAEQEISGISNVLTKETIKDHIRRWMLKGINLIPVDKDDEGQYWPGFGPGISHATNWIKSKQYGLPPSQEEVKSFQREYNFEFRVACVKKEYDSEDVSETIQPAKSTRQEFRNRFGKYRNRSLSPYSMRARYDSPERRSESTQRSRLRDYSRSRDYQEANLEAEDGVLLDGEIRIVQEDVGATKIEISHSKKDIEWCKNIGYDANDEWAKHTQLEKDPSENHSDKDSIWMEDEAFQNQIIMSQPKQLVKYTQRIQKVQIQPKQKVPVQIPSQNGRKDAASNYDCLDDQEILLEKLAALQIKKEQYVISDSEKDCYIIIITIKELIFRFSQTAKQFIQQQATSTKAQQKIASPVQRIISTGMNKDKPAIQSQLSVTPTQKTIHRGGGNVGQQTGLQSSSSTKSLSLNAELRLKETGSISARNTKTVNTQINIGQEDNAEEDEVEQTNEAALIRNKDQRSNVISQLLVYENLGTQPQNDQGLNALKQMKKYDTGPAPVEIKEKPKKGRGSKKAKVGDLNAPVEQNQGISAQDQTNTASKTPKPKAAPKRGKKAAEEVKLEPKNAKEDGEGEQDP